MNFESLQYAFEKNDLKYCEINDKDGNKIHTVRSESGKELFEKVHEFIDKVPAREYFFECKKKFNQKSDFNYSFSWSSKEETLTKVKKGHEDILFDSDALEKRIYDKVKKDFEAEQELKEYRRKIDAEREELREEKERLNSLAGKTGAILEMIGAHLMQKYSGHIQGFMQGFMQPQTGSSNLQGEQNINMSEQDKINQAMQILSELINADQFLEFALILKEKPHLVEMLPKLKNF